LDESSCLRTRLILKLRFNSGPLRIGGGEREGPILQILRVPVKGKLLPVIPESSWRGVLRRIGEWISKASRFQSPMENELVAHHMERDVLDHLMSTDVLEKIKEEVRAVEDEVLERFLPRDLISRLREEPEIINSRDLQSFLSVLCPICRLFGGQGLKGKLTLEDTVLNQGFSQPRSHVAIGRIAGVREEEHLFRAEYFFPEEVVLEVIVDNITPKSSEALILSGVIDWILKLGLEIGGFKSRGSGYLELKGGKEHSYGIFLDFQALEGRNLARAFTNPESIGRKMGLSELIAFLRG